MGIKEGVGVVVRKKIAGDKLQSSVQSDCGRALSYLYYIIILNPEYFSFLIFSILLFPIYSSTLLTKTTICFSLGILCEGNADMHSTSFDCLLLIFITATDKTQE